MATTVTIAGVDVDYQDFKIDVPLSPLGLAPTAEIELPVRQANVTAGDPVTITIDGTTAFDGTARTSGKVREDGRRTIKCNHDGIDLFEELVTFSVGDQFQDIAVLQDALAASSRGGSFTLDYQASPSVTINGGYDAEDRPLKRVFRDMMDRADNVWWVDPATNTITVDDLGGRGQWKDLDARADRVDVRQFDEGSVDSVRNAVTVVGTGAVQVRATLTDSQSISEYGRQPAEKPYNYNYVTDPTEASELADKLLIPDPLASGKIVVNKSVGDVVQPLPNYTLALDDAARGINETGLVVEKQTIRQGQAELRIGEGAGVHFDNRNRKSKSRDDNSEPGSVYDSDRIADDAVNQLKLADGSVLEDKLADAAVATAKLQNNAVINGKLDDLSVSETKIQDDSISTPKLVAEAVTANEIEADTITAAQIAAGTITALEIEADTITAAQIAADTLTANEIQTLQLDTNQIEIGADSDYYKFNTEQGITGTFVTMEPDGTSGFGFIGNPFGSTDISIQSSIGSDMDTIRPYDGDNTGSIGSSGSAYSDIYAHNYVTASPDPIESVDCSGLCDVDWYDSPPEPVRQRAKDIGDTDDEIPDGRDHTPVELGTMSNWLLEVNKAQQEKIESLEERLDALERQNT